MVRARQVMTTEQSVGEAFWFHTLDLMMLKWKHLREDWSLEKSYGQTDYRIIPIVGTVREDRR